MLRLPLLSGRKIVAVLAKFGYQEIRQRASHIRLSCPGKKSITVLDYKVISRGLLRKILRDAEISQKEFLNLP